MVWMSDLKCDVFLASRDGIETKHESKRHDERQPRLVTGKTFAHRILSRATFSRRRAED